jgi:hypothetical protein
MLWIEAIINISAFAGFIGLANRYPKDEQSTDEGTADAIAFRQLDA